MKRILICLFLCTLSFLFANEDKWPKELNLQDYKITFYQPQPNSIKGNELDAITALSIQKNQGEVYFGALSFDVSMNINKYDDLVRLYDFKYKNLRFPDDVDKNVNELIKNNMKDWKLTISYSRLLASLKKEQIQKKQSEKISTKPPKIVLTTTPTVLIYIDGNPKLKPMKDSKLFKVENTPFTIILDINSGIYYLYASEDIWYASKDIMKGWKVTKDIPQAIKDEKPKNTASSNDKKFKNNKIPDIYIATKPTELISCDGSLEFTPISKTGLMYVSNTNSDLFFKISTQMYYVLLSGRWYETKNIKKDWTFISSSDLPKDFQNIPANSSSSNVLYAVAGTTQANDAIIDAQIPQTTIIDISKASLTVYYDGKPKLKPIKGTSMKYIVNTKTAVILVGDTYYACDNGVWFQSKSPHGKWKVATDIPSVIYTIPPSNPLYNVIFVKVYKVDDNKVYVGYTAGYTNTYIYGPTIVYGTGYYYPAWYGVYYYPYPVTWGFQVRWNSYTGWAFGMSYSNGPFSFTIGFAGVHTGYWGPGPYVGYNHGYVRGYNNGYRNGYNHGAVHGFQAGKNFGENHNINKNIYNNGINRSRANYTNRIHQENFTNSKLKQNDVFANNDGQIHRKQNGTWQQYQNHEWKNSNTFNNRNQLENQFNSRQRANNFSGFRGNFSGGRHFR